MILVETAFQELPSSNIPSLGGQGVDPAGCDAHPKRCFKIPKITKGNQQPMGSLDEKA